MATAMALNGGLGLIHYNMPERQQLSEVSRVKYHVPGMIPDPIKVAPDQFVGDVLKMIEERKFSVQHVSRSWTKRENSSACLSGHVVKPRYAKRKIAEAMTPRAQVQTINKKELGKDPIARADKFFTERPGIHKLLVVDDDDHLRGLFTMNDVERIAQEKKAQFRPARDAQFRLVCGAAVSATRNAFGELDRERILTHVGGLVERGVDAVAVSTAHGHSKGVGDTVRMLRDAFPKLPIIAGNVTSAAGVEFLADCGANAIKVGPGAGLDLHHAHRGRRGHSANDGALHLLAHGGEEARDHSRRRRHHQVRRHREGVDAGARGDLRRHVRRLPRSAGRSDGNQRQTLQTIPRHGQSRRDESRLRRALRPRRRTRRKRSPPKASRRSRKWSARWTACWRNSSAGFNPAWATSARRISNNCARKPASSA